MNYYNLYREAVLAVKYGVMSIVFVPKGWVEPFRMNVDAMRNRIVEPISDDGKLVEFRVHCHTSL